MGMMSINGIFARITCDFCFRAQEIDLRPAEPDSSGQWVFDPDQITNRATEKGWIVIEGKHCCEDCAGRT